MEPLFEVRLNVEGNEINYAVHFEAENYVFQPQQADAPIIHLKREEDEWHTASTIDESLKNEAISALDRYLLAQH